MVGKKSFGMDRHMFYVYLDQKKELTNQVIKSVEFTIGMESILIKRQPFILTRVSKVPLKADMHINFKAWTALDEVQFVSIEEETKKTMQVPRASYFKNMMKHIYKMNLDI
jgi:hypothetical protein